MNNSKVLAITQNGEPPKEAKEAKAVAKPTKVTKNDKQQSNRV